jgi:hypothetical protein
MTITFKHVVARLQPAFRRAGLLHCGRPERGLKPRDYMLDCQRLIVSASE